MKLSYTTVSIAKNLDFEQSVALALDTGCAGIEFRTGGGFAHGVEVTLSPAQRSEKRRMLEDKYLEVVCINSEHEMHNPDPAERKKVIEKAIRNAELAADMGCTRMRIFGNIIPEGVNAQDCVAYVSDTLGEIADAALPMNVTILLEMHGKFNYWGYSLPTVERANRPNVGLLYNCDMRDLIGGSMHETFTRVKKHVRHVHTHDVGLGYPHLQLFEELVRMGYEDYVSAEIKETSDPTRVLRSHNQCMLALMELAKLRVGVGLTGR